IIAERRPAMAEATMPPVAMEELGNSMRRFQPFTGGSKLDFLNHLIGEFERNDPSARIGSWNIVQSQQEILRVPVFAATETPVFVNMPSFLEKQGHGRGHLIVVVDSLYESEREAVRSLSASRRWPRDITEAVIR